MMVSPVSQKVISRKSANSVNYSSPSSSLRCLVTSWSTIALIAIIATAVTVTVLSDDDIGTLDQEQTVSSFDLRKLTTGAPRHFVYGHHKPLFPLNEKDYTGFFFAVLGLMIAAGGGIGGGGILIPIYILVMGFTPKHAIPLSNITVFGGAVANTLLNAKKRHPLADRPLVDWDLILIMEPLTIAGALIGAFLNKLLSEDVLTVMLVLLLGFTANNTLKKASKMFKAESRQLKEVNASMNSPLSERGQSSHLLKGFKDFSYDTCDSDYTTMSYEDDEEHGPSAHSLTSGNEGFSYGSGDSDTSSSTDDIIEEERNKDRFEGNWGYPCDTGDRELTTASAEEDEENEKKAEEALVLDGVVGEEITEDLEEADIEQNTELQNILEQEKMSPMRNITLLVVMYVVVLFINLMKGGGAFPSPLGIKCGSSSFWAANFVNLVWIFMISLIARSYLISRYRLKESCGYKYVEGDIKWTPRATITYPAICSLAGFFAGMFGVGGGIVKGPLMLAMEVHPQVASATSACMILFTSFTATTSFVVFGLLIPDYAVVCLVIGFVATFVGQVVLNYLMKKYQRNSYIAFSIGAVVLLSAFLMTIQSMVSIAEGNSTKPSGVCGTGG